MFIRSIGFLKFLALILLCGLLAACQTSGLKPGSIQTSFAPSGWAKKPDGNKTIYYCKPSVCKSLLGVVVGPVRIRGDVETAIRENIISTELLRALDNVVNIASKGSARLTTERRVIKKTYSGFDLSARFKTSRGYYYAAARVFVQSNRGSMVASFAKSRGTAKANLRRYLSQTKIRRVP